MGVLLGLIIGMMNMVPYLPIVAAPVVYLLAIMTAVEQGQSIWWYIIGVTLVSLISQALQDAVLTPRIMGSATGLRPVVILFSVLFWGKLLGFLGLLLAIPLTCLGIAYYNRMLARQQSQMAAAASATTAGNPPAPS
jgi:predicted PurR-regulated permease PerM